MYSVSPTERDARGLMLSLRKQLRSISPSRFWQSWWKELQSYHRLFPILVAMEIQPIPFLRRGWWAVLQHGRLSFAWSPNSSFGSWLAENNDLKKQYRVVFFEGQSSWIFNSSPDCLKNVAAILNLEKKRIYCSASNSLSFSAPEWLPPHRAPYTTYAYSFQQQSIQAKQVF